MVRSSSVCDLEAEKITKLKCRQFHWTPCSSPTSAELSQPEILSSTHIFAFSLHTGCPVKLSTLWFCCFLGFHITYRRTSDHFSIAQEMRISKLTLLYFLDEKLIKLQHKTWDKLDFESIILMADFASLQRGVPTLESIISVISKSIILNFASIFIHKKK